MLLSQESMTMEMSGSNNINNNSGYSKICRGTQMEKIVKDLDRSNQPEMQSRKNESKESVIQEAKKMEFLSQFNADASDMLQLMDKTPTTQAMQNSLHSILLHDDLLSMMQQSERFKGEKVQRVKFGSIILPSPT